jgi:AcrR family transcriptional regulator
VSEPATSQPRRPYNSPARRQRVAESRERIVAAGAVLVREFTTWDWDGLTFRAVAERAGLSERTVYRHFPTERHLHDAVMARLEDEAGITYEDVELGNLTAVTARFFESLHRFAVEETVHTPAGHAFVGADERRRTALLRAVGAAAPDLTEDQQRIAAGLLDVLWSPTSYERLARAWKLDDQSAFGAVEWLMVKVVSAIRSGEIADADHSAKPAAAKRPRR